MNHLLSEPAGLLFLIIAIGIFIGRIPLGQFRMGGSGVLIAGLVFGHFGYLLPKDLQTVGIVLFVYSVGLKAGPGIAESFRKSKGVFFVLSILIVLTAGACSIFFKRVFGFQVDLISGIYAGAMTSTPALAAAMEAVGKSSPTVGYGLAYPLGILGVVLMVQVLPLIMGIDLKAEEKRYRSESAHTAILRRNFKLTNTNLNGKTLADIGAHVKINFRIARIRRGEYIFTPQADHTLLLNDLILAVGTHQDLDQLSLFLGEESREEIPESADTQSKWLVVSSHQFVGKRIGQLEISSLYGVIVTRIRRSEVEFIPDSNFVLEAGDEIRTSGAPADLERFSQLVGRDRQTVYETDFLSFALGLVIGVLIGFIKIPLGGQLSVGLGVAGGPLIAGLLFGHMGRFGQVTGHMPRAASFLTEELGLYIFLAVAGSLAGEHFVEVFVKHGFVLILSGLLITLIPVVVSVLVARFIFRMNMLVILGMICGGMTSTPALGIISSHTKSDIPALAYASIYPIAVVVTTLMAQIIVFFS
ncbi:MAG: hypothetical protein COV74_03730 [Candidatus Omnitrophica bacterium CG11_big_fil_rev_8_21_14_0_20_45_26]|uniref:RCK C-terminal domain-containing protein n=1 Tax=Candidatus Abzuiibacterium crystallinum TaxID=1974748 RepID=A0A2H0LQN3_9BACT|nr:MAG: hypothetical protein COV74_03730 [Candidatus Omnitrophica bacterium CG11_big_fil_rev_8_21_14_0_20_45_26]PIW64383.1 MAG: hypothetical protein COW12_06405 [Candidatus Omnitrophica bacterium CG12_big_fil_rev_8_21_14_0_65_45_16]